MTAICQICTNKVKTSDLANFTSTCEHKPTWCAKCVSSTIHQDLFGKMFTPKINCKYQSCNEVIGFHDVHRLAAPETFARYDGMLTKLYLESLDNYRQCLNPKCGSGQIHEGGTDYPIVRCGACGNRLCFSCNVPWHDNETCDDYAIRTAADDDAAAQGVIDATTKPCPRCKAPIEKKDGCDHMTCKCKYEFCYVCGADYDTIRKQGCKYHTASCKYYQ